MSKSSTGGSLSQKASKLVKTKIVCTLGPASSTEEQLTEMILAGMDVVRLNFSHGTQEEHKAIFERVKSISAKYDQQVAIICDIQGPKIRTGKMLKPFTIQPGDKIDVTPHEVTGTPECIQIKYETMLKDLDKGDEIFINDGIVKLKVVSKNEKSLSCVCEAGGGISDKKGCNIPSGNISLNVITPKDEKDLKFIAALDPEYVAASFIGTAEDVKKVRKYLADYGNTNIKIISKIERPIALKNLDAIIEETDAIMVARGDLGVEIPTWEVPIAQKQMCRKANIAGKPVIVATQMLESMMSASRPTRAEANDVFNAVLDGADAVMLSGETSVGKYPVEAIKVMDQIAYTAETHLPTRISAEYFSKSVGMIETIAIAADVIASTFERCKFKGKILAIVDPPYGYLARMVSKFRPCLDVIAITGDLRNAREMNLFWGVHSIYEEQLSAATGLEERAIIGIKKSMSLNLIKETDHVCCVKLGVTGSAAIIFFSVEALKKQGLI